MIMRDYNGNKALLVKHPIIVYEEGHTNRVGWKIKEKTKIILHGCYVPDNHIISGFKHSLTNPNTIVRNHEALYADRKDLFPEKNYTAANTLEVLDDHQSNNLT